MRATEILNEVIHSGKLYTQFYNAFESIGIIPDKKIAHNIVNYVRQLIPHLANDPEKFFTLESRILLDKAILSQITSGVSDEIEKIYNDIIELYKWGIDEFGNPTPELHWVWMNINSAAVYHRGLFQRGKQKKIIEEHNILVNAGFLVEIFGSQENKHHQAFAKLAATFVHELTHHIQSAGSKKVLPKTSLIKNADRNAENHFEDYKEFASYIRYLGEQQEIGARANELAAAVLHNMKEAFGVSNDESIFSPKRIAQFVYQTIREKDISHYSDVLLSFDEIIQVKLKTSTRLLLSRSQLLTLKREYQKVRERVIKQAYQTVYNIVETDRDYFEP